MQYCRRYFSKVFSRNHPLSDFVTAVSAFHIARSAGLIEFQNNCVQTVFDVGEKTLELDDDNLSSYNRELRRGVIPPIFCTPATPPMDR